jgi:hypothetical protein
VHLEQRDIEITHLKVLLNEIRKIILEATEDVYDRICGIDVECASVWDGTTFSNSYMR